MASKMIIRNALKPLLQRNTIPALRRTYVTELQEEVKFITKWRNISIFVVTPMILVPLYLNYVEPEDHTPPDFRPYEHIRLRNLPFKWGNGDHSMIHNPYVNANSEGYEKTYEHHH